MLYNTVPRSAGMMSFMRTPSSIGARSRTHARALEGRSPGAGSPEQGERAGGRVQRLGQVYPRSGLAVPVPERALAPKFGCVLELRLYRGRLAQVQEAGGWGAGCIRCHAAPQSRGGKGKAAQGRRRGQRQDAQAWSGMLRIGLAVPAPGRACR